jgi:hypothetical protein
VKQDLMLDTEHDVFIDQTKTIVCELNRASKYLNCDACHDWLVAGDTTSQFLFEDELPSSIYDDLPNAFPSDVTLPNLIEFDDECGIDAKWLALFFVKYAKGESKYRFYHVSIRYYGWLAFLKRIETMEGVYFLPYWCLCNGGYADTHIKVHRHIIIVVKNNSIGSVSGRLKGTNSKLKGPCSTSFEIKEYSHLMNAIRYACNDRSQCRFKKDKDIALVDDDDEEDATYKRNGGSSGSSHFYMHLRVIPCVLLTMGFMARNSLQSLCNIKHASAKVTDTLRYIGGIANKSHVQLRDLNMQLNHVIPLKHSLCHSMEYTDMRLELGPSVCKTRNVSRCFYECPNAIKPHSFEEYNRQAVSMGAVMFNVAMNSIYKLNKTQLSILKRVGVLVDEVAELKRRDTEHTKQILELKERVNQLEFRM